MLRFPSQTTAEWTPKDTQFYVTCFLVFLWHLFCLSWVSRRMCPNYWFIRGCAELGQATGTFWIGARRAARFPLCFSFEHDCSNRLWGTRSERQTAAAHVADPND
jgi:hypothetical protein